MRRPREPRPWPRERRHGPQSSSRPAWCALIGFAVVCALAVNARHMLQLHSAAAAEREGGILEAWRAELWGPWRRSRGQGRGSRGRRMLFWGGLRLNGRHGCPICIRTIAAIRCRSRRGCNNFSPLDGHGFSRSRGPGRGRIDASFTCSRGLRRLTFFGGGGGFGEPGLYLKQTRGGSPRLCSEVGRAVDASLHCIGVMTAADRDHA